MEVIIWIRKIYYLFGPLAAKPEAIRSSPDSRNSFSIYPDNNTVWFTFYGCQKMSWPAEIKMTMIPLSIHLCLLFKTSTQLGSLTIFTLLRYQTHAWVELERKKSKINSFQTIVVLPKRKKSTMKMRRQAKRNKNSLAYKLQKNSSSRWATTTTTIIIIAMHRHCVHNNNSWRKQKKEQEEWSYRAARIYV